MLFIFNALLKSDRQCKMSYLLFLIDDDLDDQEFFSIVIEETCPSVQYVFANDGVHALEKLNGDTSFVPDIILIDINMPRINGINCLIEIKKLPRLKGSHIYMYSTSVDPSIAERCGALGACGFIKKEATTEALQKKITEAVSKLKTPQRKWRQRKK